MKKFFVLFVLMALAATFSFGQIIVPGDGITVSNTEIANMVEKAKPINRLAGIRDLNKIWPGQTVWVPVEVRPGDTYWWICRDIAFPPYYSEPQSQITPKDQSDPKGENGFLGFLHSIPLWLWLLLGWLILGLVVSILIANSKKSVNPVTAGAPQIPGGVNDQNAHSRMRDLASQRFPGARINVQNIRRGTLSGKATVHYADGKPKKLNLNNVVAYAGEIMVNNQLETIYFLQGCGNDARQGNYMSGNGLVFTPDVVINQDGSESSFPDDNQQGKDSVTREQIKEAQESLAKKKEEVIKIQANESVKTISDCFGLVANSFLEKTHAHKVTIEYFNQENGVMVAREVLETKNVVIEPKKDEAK